MTPERERQIREAHASRECSYVGKCNSSRCPRHGGEARAIGDLLAALDEARAQLAALREAAAESIPCACSGASGCPWSSLHRALADAEAAAEAYAHRVRAEALPERIERHDRRVRANALREAADWWSDQDDDMPRWLRARACEIEAGQR